MNLKQFSKHESRREKMAFVFTLYIFILKLTGLVSSRIYVKRIDEGDIISVRRNICKNIINSDLVWPKGKCRCNENAATFHCLNDKHCGCYNRTELDTYKGCNVYLDASPVNVPTLTKVSCYSRHNCYQKHKYSYDGRIVGKPEETFDNTVQIWEDGEWHNGELSDDNDRIVIEVKNLQDDADDDYLEGKLLKIKFHSNQSGATVCMLVKLSGTTTYQFSHKSTSRPTKSTTSRTSSPVTSTRRTMPANTDNSGQNNDDIIIGIVIPMLLVCVLILSYLSYRCKRKGNKDCNDVKTNTQNDNIDNVADTRAYATLNLQNVPENNYAYLSQQSIYSQPYGTIEINEDTDPPLYRTLTNTEDPLYMVTEPDEENKIHPVYAVTEPENNNCDDELAVSENKYSDTPAPIYMETEPET